MTRQTFIAPLVLGLGFVAFAACDFGEDPADGGASAPVETTDDGSDEPLASPEARLCERVDECGYLGAGYSVGDCTDIVGACTDDLLTSAKADWDNAAEECLELNNCQNFGSCFASIDVCIADVEIEFEVEVEVGDDGPTAPTDPGDDTCEPYQICTDDYTLEACIDGEVYSFDCDFVCESEGFEGSIACAYDGEIDADVCLCV